MCACAFCGGAAPHLRGFFGLCLTAKHKPFCQTNRSCAGERGGPGPNCRAGHSLTAAFILLLFLLHTQGFLGFLKYFSRSVLPLPPSIPPPLFLSFCHRALIGCYDRAVAGLSASSKAQFNYSFSPTWHVHAQMHANSHTHEGKSQTHTQTHKPTCPAARRAVLAVMKKASVIELSVSHSTWQSRPPDVPQQSFENTM